MGSFLGMNYHSSAYSTTGSNNGKKENLNGNIKQCCSTAIVGGHTLEGTVAKTMPRYSNDVLLIPICKTHNSSIINGGSSGTGFYMKAKEKISILKLQGYYPTVIIKKALERQGG